MVEPLSSPLDIPTMLAAGMGPRLHWFPEDVSPSKLAETMVGMANSEGGDILIGVAPRSGRVQGISNEQRVVDRIFQASLLTDPPLVIPLPQIYPLGEAHLIWITIPPGLPQVYSIGGRYLGREGRHTTPLSARRLRRLLLERGVVLFEAQVPPDATLDDLDPPQVEAYLQRLSLPGDEPTEEVLLRRGCLKYEGGALRPTYAALLLFGRHPQQWLPSATVLAASFSGIAFGDEFIKQQIGGSLPQQIRQAEQFVRQNVRHVVRVIGLTHQETPEYPLEAVRELLVNAVAHRDYNLQGDSIHLHIFADRLEIHSPGGLPGPVTLENLLEARFSRNPVIVQVLADMGFVERLGYGLDRVVTIMRKNGLQPPRFEEVAGSFRVTLYGETLPQNTLPDLSRYRDLELNPRQQMALSYLITHPRITNRIYQQLCPDVHPETLRRDLAEMVKRGLLLKIGDKRATYYILKK